MLMEATLGWYSVLPFVAMLAAIAVAPLVPSLAHWWDHPRHQLLYSLILGVPVAIWMALTLGASSVGHALVEYSQFIVLLLALYTISGGIHLAGDLVATPRTNAAFLAVGALLASIIGTTGAAMLLIRPLLKTNSERQHTTHTVIYFIFIVANAGGLLTPLGDPPLFLGMLRGVPFTWTLTLFPEWLFVNGLLLVSYLALDAVMLRREDPGAIDADRTEVAPLRLLGKRHLALLAIVVVAVALIPSIDLEAVGHGAAWWAWVPWRELVMLAAAGASILLGTKRVRYHLNEFSWAPIQEVAALFIGIFLTMIPALRVLAQAAPKLPLNEVTFFIFTGGLSSVLDNAPTYATFFEMARAIGGDGALVAGVPEGDLRAISLGAVLCGALTYIGNGPNFMVKSVADSHGVVMPSFGRYIMWSMWHLAPALLAMCLLFIADPWWAKLLGAAVTVWILGAAAARLGSSRRVSPHA